MHVNPNNLSVADCRGSCSAYVERSCDNIIIINNPPTRAYVTLLSWILAGSALGIAGLSIVTSQNFSALVALIFVFLGSIAFISRQTKTEINLADKTIRKTWKIGFCKRHTVYSLDDISSVEVKDKSRMVEGYSLPFYTVQLTGKGKKITIYSADESEEAKALKVKVQTLLKQSALSTQLLQ